MLEHLKTDGFSSCWKLADQLFNGSWIHAHGQVEKWKLDRSFSSCKATFSTGWQDVFSLPSSRSTLQLNHNKTNLF